MVSLKEKSNGQEESSKEDSQEEDDEEEDCKEEGNEEESNEEESRQEENREEEKVTTGHEPACFLPPSAGIDGAASREFPLGSIGVSEIPKEPHG